ncbi:unnamed protein product [Tuber melanosporum]|uniref:(Perigord truffle) hypothetical protein n=1 Tax=Tuber melanosporum (strain Mel28) TaxID=656061 RepID=D5GCT8_TUBMM|nr:uncharacterized protein GSTUM_00000823001 [Tuber melanosporum]CAZ82331.1 unnamed protein product [Tuber melanosporum]
MEGKHRTWKNGLQDRNNRNGSREIENLIGDSHDGRHQNKLSLPPALPFPIFQFFLPYCTTLFSIEDRVTDRSSKRRNVVGKGRTGGGSSGRRKSQPHDIPSVGRGQRKSNLHQSTARKTG